METTEEELQCYNKACGAKYIESQNNEKACLYHPGVPVFHDALKGWSCCKKRTTDFTEFLKIPGCTHGYHSNKKPVQDLKPQVKSCKNNVETPIQPTVVLPTPKPIQQESYERPSADEPLIKLTVKVTSTYNKQKAVQVIEKEDVGTIKIGTKCRNGGCDAAYANGPSDDSKCLHHPGTPVFHEGMKYWSCCRRKTSDFTSFLNQAGCTSGTHVWKTNVSDVKVTCRYDYHQTGQNVIVAVFAKHCNIDTSSFEANQVYLKLSLNYEGNKHFDLNMHLHGVIDPTKSFVTVSGTKAELTLRKGRAKTWKTLGEVDDRGDENEKLKEEIEEIKKQIEEESQDSDLDGIDDVIFD